MSIMQNALLIVLCIVTYSWSVLQLKSGATGTRGLAASQIPFQRVFVRSFGTVLLCVVMTVVAVIILGVTLGVLALVCLQLFNVNIPRMLQAVADWPW